MLFRRFYYTVKPMLPWHVRMAVRRYVAMRALRRHRDVWPILPGSEKPPAGWPGWPDEKKFALVLTHDVEGEAGLEKVRPLMELEMQLGFRSAFYFIPEGEYRVPAALRGELVRNGFEVGVHDLYHDGKLFNSRKSFSEHAAKINRYLNEWGAVGFRAGFMLNQLDWLHQLDIQYDTSTFDTDPFEPQPEGVGTIFPFWVGNCSATKARPLTGELGSDPGDMLEEPNSASTENTSRFRSGYVELPYTLPQDLTVFLLFREQTNEIWRRKLDWIARHGGMALVDVHPDYLHFDGDQRADRSVSVTFYAELLRYIRENYGTSFWHALPCQVAAYVRESCRAISFRPRKRVCMVTYSHYETDNRVMRYAEALAERGDHVDVVALSRSRGQAEKETVAGVNLYRIQARPAKGQRAKLDYLMPLARFLLASSIWLVRNHLRRRYDLVHVHNVPDFLVFSALIPKLMGAKVILDIHDILPEFYVSKFNVSRGALTVKALLFIERLCARIADHVILANHLWFDKYTQRAASAVKCSVFINYVDMRRFRPGRRTRTDNRIIVLFPGGLQWHQGVDIAIRAFQKVLQKFPNAEFHIYGDGSMKPELVALASELGLDGKVRFFDPVPADQIVEIMANADVGVVPKRADSFGNEAYSTKILEFMAVGVPVVVSDTKIDRFYFDDSVVKFFASGDENALADAMLLLIGNKATRAGLVAKGYEYVARNSWDAAKNKYLSVVDALTSPDVNF